MPYYLVPFWLCAGGLSFLKRFSSITVICSFQVRCSSINTLKYLIEVIRFISLSFLNNNGSFEGILSFARALWKNVYLVLSLFRDNLFGLNHLKALFISKLAIGKVLLCFCVKRKDLYHLQTLWAQIF